MTHSRRTFLTTTAAAAALAPHVFADDEKKEPKPVRIGFIGVGGRGTGLAATGTCESRGLKFPSSAISTKTHYERAARLVEKDCGKKPGRVL